MVGKVDRHRPILTLRRDIHNFDLCDATDARAGLRWTPLPTGVSIRSRSRMRPGDALQFQIRDALCDSGF
jgi:hypothetical protein